MIKDYACLLYTSNVFIKDVDGNIPYDTGSSGEKVTGLLFDVSLQPTLFTELCFQSSR